FGCRASGEKNGDRYNSIRIVTMAEFAKICDFGELQGFALRINRTAVYSADIIIAQKPPHARAWGGKFATFL
ncbi:MAG: hypothetical protein IJU66_04405, partial [Oscillospiraceae bacterium]|nr:hypothetical protein [Oscillospiraceae bacterium]